MIKTAEEVRKITKITPSPKAKRILKCIEKEILKCAKSGKFKLIYREYDVEQNVVNAVFNELRFAGYKLSMDDISDDREGDNSVQFNIRW